MSSRPIPSPTPSIRACILTPCPSGGLPSPKLGLNCVGGSSATALAKQLAAKGVLVTYGGMAREPVIVPTPVLIFKDIHARGYWHSGHWLPNSTWDQREAMFRELNDMVCVNKLRIPHVMIPLEDAMSTFGESKGKKVILTM